MVLTVKVAIERLNAVQFVKPAELSENGYGTELFVPRPTNATKLAGASSTRKLNVEPSVLEPECDAVDQSAKLRAVARAVARADHAPEQGANDERADAGTDDKPVVAACGRAKRRANDLGPND